MVQPMLETVFLLFLPATTKTNHKSYSCSSDQNLNPPTKNCQQINKKIETSLTSKKRLPLHAEQEAWVDLMASLHTTQKRKMFVSLGIQAHFLSYPTCSLVTTQTTLSQLMPLIHINLYYFQNQLSLSGWSSCAMDFSFLLHILCGLRNYCNVTICQ